MNASQLILDAAEIIMAEAEVYNIQLKVANCQQLVDDLPSLIFLPLYNTVIRYFAILYKVCKLITKYLPVLVNQAFPPLSVIYFSSTTWKMKNLR